MPLGHHVCQHPEAHLLPQERGNDVHFINMRSHESYAWKDVSAGRDGGGGRLHEDHGKPRRYLLEALTRFPPALMRYGFPVFFPSIRNRPRDD
jgi:hypothetical protein